MAIPATPPDDGFDFEIVDVCTDDEYEFVEAPVSGTRAAPPPAAAPAQPVAAAVGGDQVVPPSPDHEPITGFDDDTETIAVAVAAPTRSPSPPPPPGKEEKAAVVPWQFNHVEVSDEAPRARDVTSAAVAAALPPLWYASAHGQAYGEADQYDEDDDDGEYDATYRPCYDFADFGRSRSVKRSSGRRGRTKKKTAMGRPRGEERSSHIAGKW